MRYQLCIFQPKDSPASISTSATTDTDENDHEDAAEEDEDELEEHEKDSEEQMLDRAYEVVEEELAVSILMLSC